MTMFADDHVIEPGDPAPDFTVPWIERDGTVSLSDYRGRPVLLVLVRGLWCPFCRRSLAEVGAAAGDFAAAGVETLGVVATAPDNARLYLRYRPSRLPLAADPDMKTHARYGLPRPTPTPELMAAVAGIRTDVSGALPEPMPFEAAVQEINRIDEYSYSPADGAEMERGMTQLTGHFLVDADGIVRWTDIECAQEGLAGLGKFPCNDELLEVARTLT